jgi:hypothetical protein
VVQKDIGSKKKPSQWSLFSAFSLSVKGAGSLFWRISDRILHGGRSGSSTDIATGIGRSTTGGDYTYDRCWLGT